MLRSVTVGHAGKFNGIKRRCACDIGIVGINYIVRPMNLATRFLEISNFSEPPLGNGWVASTIVADSSEIVVAFSLVRYHC